MPRTEEAKQRVREEQRAKILDAARKVFARKGLAATMAEVAAEAGVSQGLAYRYFPGKEELFQTMVEQILQASPTLTRVVAEQPGTPGERLSWLITRIVESRRDQPEFYQLFYQMLYDESVPNDLRERVRIQGLHFQQVLRQLIVEGQATGEIAQDDPDQLIVAVMACLEGLWRGIALLEPLDVAQVKKHFPDANIILRMLKPCSNER